MKRSKIFNAVSLAIILLPFFVILGYRLGLLNTTITLVEKTNGSTQLILTGRMQNMREILLNKRLLEALTISSVDDTKCIQNWLKSSINSSCSDNITGFLSNKPKILKSDELEIPKQYYAAYINKIHNKYDNSFYINIYVMSDFNCDGEILTINEKIDLDSNLNVLKINDSHKGKDNYASFRFFLGKNPRKNYSLPNFCEK
ncbi:hypothetical protein KKB55_12945 [Myxococcota bacterium]|nr:hypothetical protein [Myxococcota bacterium]MBU1898648.1 hypothetical protein [Myxococcota bacterium]